MRKDGRGEILLDPKIFSRFSIDDYFMTINEYNLNAQFESSVLGYSSFLLIRPDFAHLATGCFLIRVS